VLVEAVTPVTLAVVAVVVTVTVVAVLPRLLGVIRAGRCGSRSRVSLLLLVLRLDVGLLFLVSRLDVGAGAGVRLELTSGNRRLRWIHRRGSSRRISRGSSGSSRRVNRSRARLSSRIGLLLFAMVATARVPVAVTSPSTMASSTTTTTAAMLRLSGNDGCRSISWARGRGSSS